MKKQRFTLFMLLLAITIATKANSIDIRTASQIGFKFMNANTNIPLHSVDELKLAATYYSKRGKVAFYIFNCSNSFVIVAADDFAHPILGYSLDCPWPTNRSLTPQVKDYLDDLANQIEAAASIESDRRIATEWSNLLNDNLQTSDSRVQIGPLLTTTWDQGQYYNTMCPGDVNGPGRHTVTGCVATAMAQIIKYWEYPTRGQGSYSYPHNIYGTQSVNFDNTIYDYPNMPASLSSTSTSQQIQSVAQLIFHCGVAVTMDYGPVESSASDLRIPTALMYYFGYDIHTRYLEKQKFSDEEWDQILQSNLIDSKPIIYCGGSDSRHCFICDGYNENNYYHFNFGWSGMCDGWYLLSAINVNGISFTNRQIAIVDIMPDTSFESSTYWTDIVSQQPEGYSLDSVGIIHIYSAEGLAWWAKMAINANDIDKDVVLETDIDLSEHLWKPITWYRGAFDGKGHCIIGLHAIESFPYGAGFFGDYIGRSIHDVGFIDAIVKGDYTAGVIAGNMMTHSMPFDEYMTIQNCYVQNCYVLGNSPSGGIAGQCDTRVFVKNCYASGYCYSIQGAGGLFGRNQGDITNCYTSLKDLSAIDWCQASHGVITGHHTSGVLKNCYADSDYISQDRNPVWSTNNIDYMLGSSNNYEFAFDLFTFTKENGSAHILLDDINNINNTDTCTNLLTALNQNVNYINSPELRTWIWDNTTNLPKFGDYYVTSCPNIDSLSIQNMFSEGELCASITWKELGDATSWEIKCVPLSNTAEITSYYLSDSTNYFISGLTIGNCYEVYVKPLCECDSLIGWGTSVIFQYDLPYWTDVVTTCPDGFQEDIHGNVTISSAEGLSWLSSCVNGLNGQSAHTYQDKTITLTQDINLEGYKWKPIGHHYYHPNNCFMGSFDGGNHVISNLYCNERIVESMPLKNTCVGLFGSALYATFKDLRLENSNVNGYEWVAALVGHADNCNIDYCHATANVTGVEKVGTLVGEIYQSLVSNCSSTGDVYGSNETGLLIGMIVGSSITNSYALGVLRCNSMFYMGGFCGHVAQSSIYNCYHGGYIDFMTENPGIGISGSILGGTRVSSTISNLYYFEQSIIPKYQGEVYPQYSWIPEMYIITSEDIIDENGQVIPTIVSDTSSFAESNGELFFNSPVNVADSQYTNVLSALNAWVNANNDEDLYYYWAADTLGLNGGFPIFVDAPIYNITITANPNPVGGGVVAGAGIFNQGTTCTLIAKANEGYVFINWTENGNVVSTEATYVFTVTNDRNLVANFGCTGIDDNDYSLFIYPNPVAAGQHFNLNSHMGSKVQLEIFNALGVLKSACTPLVQPIIAPNIPGIYVLRITVEGEGMYYRKLIVK